MNEKTRIQIEEMKKQTIGCEIEMTNITRQTTIRTIAAYFGTENTVENTRQNRWYCLDNQGRRWTAMGDGSITATSGSEACELVTPILKYEDIPDLQEIVRKLRHKGAISNPNHCCGVHIHIGANDHNAKTLRNLTNIMASHEELLIKALKLDRYRLEQYCSTVDRDFLYEVNKRKPKRLSELADIWYGEYSDRSYHYNSTRYHMLNLHATFTKGTVEFRLFQFDNPENGRRGGLHAGQLKSYIQLCLAMNQMAKSVRSASPKPQQHENLKYAMRTWLLRLGFIGDEFKTARELFTKRLEGDTAFRYGRA